MPPLFFVLCIAALFLSRLPGTADVNVWKAWIDGLSEAGFIAGYNAGAGHIVQPPLGMLLLVASHRISPWLGVPVYVWPAVGWTGYALCVWAFLVLGAAVSWRVTGRAVWAVAFQLAFTLNLVYGYFDLFGIPFFLLAIHGLANRRWSAAWCWMLLAVLIKWQFLVFVPFMALHALREFAVARPRPWKREAIALAPAAAIALVAVLVVGPGTLRSLSRGLAHDTLSGYALNTPWLLTWAMHLRWPESYGPLEDGMIHVLRTQDTRVLALVRLLFGTSFLFALWRQWRLAPSPETVLRTMLAGYLAYFLFNKGAHENHLVPAIGLAGYLAWREPRWRPAAVAVAVAANLNMYFFYALDGTDRGSGRVMLGLDLSLPLALAYVIALGWIFLDLCGLWPPGRGARPRAS